MYALDESYTYTLSFINCCYFEYQRDNLGTYAEYLNGRFKNSAKLKEVSKQSKYYFYHLRIQLADGYLDLIFNKFLIEKNIGDIVLPKRITIDWHFDFIKDKFLNMSIDEIRMNAISGDFPLRSYPIEYLWNVKDDSIYEFARNYDLL